MFTTSRPGEILVIEPEFEVILVLPVVICLLVPGVLCLDLGGSTVGRLLGLRRKGRLTNKILGFQKLFDGRQGLVGVIPRLGRERVVHVSVKKIELSVKQDTTHPLPLFVPHFGRIGAT